MTRVLVVNDIHMSDKPLGTTADTYVEDLFDLLAQTVRITTTHKCDAVVWAGDVFDHKLASRNSHRTIMRLIDLGQSYPCKWYIVAGNHDILNDRLDSIHETQPLGVLYRAGAIELDGWSEEFPDLYGVPWQQRWLEPGTIAAAFEGWRDRIDSIETKALTVSHAPIYPPGFELEFEFLPTKGPDGVSTAMGNQGAIAYGHIHETHGVFNVEGVQYCNMGALSRGSLKEYNLTRDIAVAIYDTTTGEFDEIVLNYRPPEEALKMEIRTTRIDKRTSDHAFLNSVGSARMDLVSVESVHRHIDSLDIPRNVADRSKEYIEGARN